MDNFIKYLAIVLMIAMVVGVVSLNAKTTGTLEKQPMLQMNFSESDSTDVLSVEDIKAVRDNLMAKIKTIVKPYLAMGTVVSYITVSPSGVDCDNTEIKKAVESQINWQKLPKAVGEVRLSIY